MIPSLGFINHYSGYQTLGNIYLFIINDIIKDINNQKDAWEKGQRALWLHLPILCSAIRKSPEPILYLGELNQVGMTEDIIDHWTINLQSFSSFQRLEVRLKSPNPLVMPWSQLFRNTRHQSIKQHAKRHITLILGVLYQEKG